MKVKKETAVKSAKSLYTGAGAATVAALLVTHFAPSCGSTEMSAITGVLAGGLGMAWRLFVGILETRFGLAKYL